MCGIAGQIRFDGSTVSEQAIRAMTDAIAHRGPDGEGQHTQGSVGLGHRRLSIIDLEGGAQPMATPDKNIVLTYNGEIYNFKELKSELEQLGHKFSTTSDTEVILFAWRQWGKSCVKRFRGMFAFCLVDFEKREYLLARDHFGIKPVLYSANKDFLVFASEFVALEAVSDLELTGSLRSIEWFLTLQYIPHPFTIYNEVRKLPPAHLIHGRLDEAKATPERYWQEHYNIEVGKSAEDWVELADATLRESVKTHMIADVPVGAFVSGGIDSSLIALYMNELGLGPDPAFSIGFEEESHSELKWANQIASKLEVSLDTKVVTPSAWDEIENIVLQYGEPFGDNSMIPTFALAELARSKVPVCLSGDAGDEAFGGYHSYNNWLAIPKIKRRWRKLRKKLSRREWQAFIWAVGRRFGSTRPRADEWLGVVQYTREDARDAVWLPEVDGSWRQNESVPLPFHSAHESVSKHEMLAYAQEMDFATYLPNCILTKVDIASMAHGLEVRTPLLDLEVVGLAHRLPIELRSGPADTSFIGKKILKDLLEPTMGKDFVHRRKQGFGIPRSQWFMPDASGSKLFRDVALSSDGGLSEWFSSSVLERMLQEHSEKRDKSALLWLLLVLAIWRKNHRGIPFK